MKRFAVLASGNGSNLQAIIEAVKVKMIKADLLVVLSDKENAYALTRAKEANIKHVLFMNPKEYATRVDYDAAILEKLKSLKIDFVVLAGFMRILSPTFIKGYQNKILNIHPAFLPAFKGAHAIEDAFEAKVFSTGVTVHIVDEEVDHGTIIEQVEIEIKPGDTLETLKTRIHKVEHQLFPAVIAKFAKQ